MAASSLVIYVFISHRTPTNRAEKLMPGCVLPDLNLPKSFVVKHGTRWEYALVVYGEKNGANRGLADYLLSRLDKNYSVSRRQCYDYNMYVVHISDNPEYNIILSCIPGRCYAFHIFTCGSIPPEINWFFTHCRARTTH